MTDTHTTEQTSLEHRIATWRRVLEDSIEKQLHPLSLTLPPSLSEAIRHATLGGGHRFRPILVLAVAEEYEVSHSQALPLANLVELVHSASMIIDDLPSFDNATIRHGKLACHKAFGEYIAILASHRLSSMCFEITWGLQRKLSRETATLLEAEYTRVINAMIRGEVQDIATRSQKIADGDLLEIYNGKSAQLFSFSALGAALVANRTKTEVQALREYGLNLGIAYQILDDIYDLHGGPSDIGKEVAMDLRNNKASTVPILYGIEHSVTALGRYKQEARVALNSLDRRTHTLDRLIDVIVPTPVFSGTGPDGRPDYECRDPGK